MQDTFLGIYLAGFVYIIGLVIQSSFCSFFRRIDVYVDVQLVPVPVCMYVCMYVCMHVCTYECMYISMYV